MLKWFTENEKNAKTAVSTGFFTNVIALAGIGWTMYSITVPKDAPAIVWGVIFTAIAFFVSVLADFKLKSFYNDAVEERTKLKNEITQLKGDLLKFTSAEAIERKRADNYNQAVKHENAIEEKYISSATNAEEYRKNFYQRGSNYREQERLDARVKDLDEQRQDASKQIQAFAPRSQDDRHKI